MTPIQSAFLAFALLFLIWQIEGPGSSEASVCNPDTGFTAPDRAGGD